MSYNLLLDTSFTQNKMWKYKNCKYENGYLISNNKVFGIEQELILPNPTKLYFRWNYKTENASITDVKIGIQNDKVLNISCKYPKLNKKQSISVIDVAKQSKIKLHLIFESKEKVNKVYIDSPLLVDLISRNKATWLKWLLDKTLYFTNGYTYENIYNTSEIKPTSIDFTEIGLDNAKIGSMIKTLKTIDVPLTSELIENNYYLIKLDLKEINKFGKIYFKYGVAKSNQIINDQIFLIFKANNNDKLSLYIEPTDVLPYSINLRHILLINITKMNLDKSDIPYISFI